MVNTIFLEHAVHNNRVKLFLKFEYDRQTVELAKALAGIKWSHTHKGWYLDYHPELIPLVQQTFVPQGIQLNFINALEDVKQSTPDKKPGHALPDLNKVQTEKIVQFRNWLTSKRYSSNTIKTYTDSIQIFLRYYEAKPVNEITNDDVIAFNNDYILANSFSASYQNQVVNAIKLFFKILENRQLQPELIHRPKTQKLLPNVLSKEEIKCILNAHGNIKHKAMLSLIYSCGLRRSELLNLKLTDIDSKRGLVIIRQAKGRKDRIAPLSDKILKLLRNYFTACKPKQWLFEGHEPNTPYTENSLANVLKQALQKSKISKPVTLHWLRHSYATHLLENGTDLRYIQEILGHSRSSTTEIYTHVSNKSIQKVISPFDNL